MSIPIESLKRIEQSIEATNPALAAELQDALRDVRRHIALAEAEAKELANAQAEALIHSADVIYELEETKEQLEKATAAAQASNIAKSQFLANMSHEIRTPLNGVLGFTEILIEQDEELSREDRLEFLTCIQTSGKHLLSVINDILDLSKIESENLELEYLDYSPHALIAEVISLLRAKAQEKGLRLESEWIGPLPETIKTDPTRLRQLLLNLVGNAIKFTNQGEVFLSARIDQTQERARLVIDIKDTGTGIPEEKQQSIFEAFQQADNSITRQFGGTGLGLSISKQLAVAMGGDITVKSTPGEGSTFTVTIDVGHLDETKMLEAPQADGLASSTKNGNCDEQQNELSPFTRVLLVEDGEINRKLILALLSRAGLEDVDIAENGEIAVQKTVERDYDIILMDMQMPIMDGYAAARKLREMGNETPIIALTAHAMKGDMDKCIAAGCTDYLSKPIDDEKLFDKIIAHTAQREPKTAPETTSPGVGSEQNKVAEVAEEVLESTLPIHNEVFLEIVRDFGELLTKLMSELKTRLQEQDRERIKQIAHDIAGTAGGAGFGSFTEPARQLEQIAMTADFSVIEANIDTLKALAARVRIPELAT